MVHLNFHHTNSHSINSSHLNSQTNDHFHPGQLVPIKGNITNINSNHNHQIQPIGKLIPIATKSSVISNNTNLGNIQSNVNSAISSGISVFCAIIVKIHIQKVDFFILRYSD